MKSMLHKTKSGELIPLDKMTDEHLGRVLSCFERGIMTGNPMPYIEEIRKREQPNPMHYEDSPKGEQQFNDDYWGGDINAMLYHQDIGDR